MLGISSRTDCSSSRSGCGGGGSSNNSSSSSSSTDTQQEVHADGDSDRERRDVALEDTDGEKETSAVLQYISESSHIFAMGKLNSIGVLTGDP